MNVILSGVNQKSEMAAWNLFSHQYVWLALEKITHKYKKAIILFIDTS
jgi:2-polyprenyl-3-methyl-5-hydroxy-6-metoxy-1,4-benzoquinol methylase